MRRPFVSLKGLVKPRGSHNLSGVSIFLNFNHLWCWPLLSLLFNTVIIILNLDWMNELPFGTNISYLMYWSFMLRCNTLRFDVWSFNGSSSLLLYSKNVFPHNHLLVGQLSLIIYQIINQVIFSVLGVAFSSQTCWLDQHLILRASNIVCSSGDLILHITRFFRCLGHINFFP